MCSADVFLALIALLFPPLPVWVKCGICSADSIINILLCVLGYLPGLLHSWYIIAKFPEPPYEYEALPQDREGGRVTYVYVQAPPAQQRPHAKQGTCPHHQQQGMNYGTQNVGGGGAIQQQQQEQPQQQQQPQPQPQQSGVTSGNGEGSSENQGVPPSYAEVVAGDHKIQASD